MTIDEILSRLHGVKKTTKGHKALCPAHLDRSPSLSVGETPNRDVLLHCFAGCEFGDIIAALGIRASDCFANPGFIRKQYFAQHTIHALDSEVETLVRRYGLSHETAKALVRVHLKRHAGGMV